jgi:hypothetical protein
LRSSGNCSIEGGKEEEIKEGDDAGGWKELGRFYLFFLLCFQLFITVEHSHKATTIQTKIETLPHLHQQWFVFVLFAEGVPGTLQACPTIKTNQD